MMYLALDPGHTTGYAVFDDNGNGVENAEVFDRKGVYDLLDRVKPDVIIMEDWITKQGVALGGDKLETVRVIGAVEYWAYSHGATVVLQPNTVKSIAYRWAGISKPKTKALEHKADAYVHGVYYLQKAGIRYPQQGRGQ